MGFETKDGKLVHSEKDIMRHPYGIWNYIDR